MDVETQRSERICRLSAVPAHTVRPWALSQHLGMAKVAPCSGITRSGPLHC